MENYNIHLASLSDKNLRYDFAKGIHFHVKTTSNNSSRNRLLIRLLKSPGILVFASDIPSSHKIKFLPSGRDEFCDRLNLLLQEKQAAKNSDIILKKSLLSMINY